MKTQTRNLLLPFWLSITIVTLSACGGGGGGNATPPGSNNNNTSPENLNDTLDMLGIDTTVTPRVDENGQTIDDNYAPMGRNVSLIYVDNGDGTRSLIPGVRKELFLAGLRTQNCIGANCQATLIDDVAAVADFRVAPDILYQRAENAPWINENLDTNALPETRRDATGSDVDSDGISEIVMVYYDATDDEVHLSITDADAPDTPVEDIILPLNYRQFPIADLRITSGNFDDDTEEELAIGIGSHSSGTFNDARAYVLILDGKSTDYSVLKQIDIPAIDRTRSISLVLKSAQLDYDRATELVVVQNETGSDPVNRNVPGMGVISVVDAEAFYTIFDDVTTEANIIKSGHVDTTLDQTPSGTARATVANIAVGDTDNDTLDEVFFAGLSNMPYSGRCDPVGHLLIAFDDKVHNFNALSGAYSPVSFAGQCPEFDGWRLRFVHLNLLDIDGDDDLEIQANEFVFDTAPTGNQDWYTASTYTPQLQMLFRSSEARAFFDRSNSVITVGDITGDGRDNIVSYLQGETTLNIYGVAAGSTNLTRMAQTNIIPWTQANPTSDRINPVVVPMNSDKDTSVYGLISHEYAITEPIVLGVLAAPPCQTGIGQNLDSCSTTWGYSSTDGVGRDRGFQVSAGVNVGFSADTQSCAGVGYSQCTTIFEIEAKASLEVVLDRTRSSAYELTKSIAFTTGALEDSVVFSSIPVDTYTYGKLSLADSVSRGGDVDIVVTLPREPVISMTPISYYNQSVIDENARISDSVFQHTPGDISTYPTAERKDMILAQRRSQLEDVRIDRFTLFNPIFDDDAPLDALQGLDLGPTGVVSGSNSAVELTMDLATESSLSVTHEVNFSLEVNVAAGPGTKFLAGFSVGVGGHHTLNVSRGSATTYSGSVGSIESDNYADNRYQFGLFTYLEANPHTGREFEVINYWVQ